MPPTLYVDKDVMWLSFGHQFDTCLPTSITTPTTWTRTRIYKERLCILTFLLLNAFSYFQFEPFLTYFMIFHFNTSYMWSGVCFEMSSLGLRLGPVSGRNYFQCIFSLCRRITCTRRPFRLWFTLFLARHPITLKCGRPPLLPTAMSVRVCCGALRGRACAAQSVESNATKNARSFSTQTVYRVSHQPNTEKQATTKQA